MQRQFMGFFEERITDNLIALLNDDVNQLERFFRRRRQRDNLILRYRQSDSYQVLLFIETPLTLASRRFSPFGVEN